MEDAQNQMAAQCGPNNYTIVQQGEEAIGTDTYTQENTGSTDHTSRSGRTTTSDTSTQGTQSPRTATAWRVHYQCNGALPAAGQMPPPGGQPLPPPGGGQTPPPAGPPPGPAPGY